MRRGRWIAVGILVLPAAEIGAFVLVAMRIGWAPALALVLASSLAGLAVLRRHGSGWNARIRAAAEAGGAEGAAQAILSGGDMAMALAGILLLLPGFITSIAAGVLLFPKGRQWLGATIRRAAGPVAPPPGSAGVVDLAPGEWRQVGEKQPEPREIRGR